MNQILAWIAALTAFVVAFPDLWADLLTAIGIGM